MGGNVTVAVLAFFTAVDESTKGMVKGVVRSPNRLSSRDGDPSYYHRLEYDIFLLPCLFIAASFNFCLSLCFLSHPSRPYHVCSSPL